jgi:hypothetical protein
MNLDAQGQRVLDSNGIPMEVGKYYNYATDLNVKYLGQKIDNKDAMQFQRQDRSNFVRIVDDVNRPIRIENDAFDEGDIATDDEDRFYDSDGGKRRRKSKSKKRISKARKSKKMKSRKNKTKRRR